MSVLSSPTSPSSCRKKHIVCKSNMSFGLFHCCELTSCVFLPACFSFSFDLIIHPFSLQFFIITVSNLIFFAGCSTPHSSQLRLILYSYWGREAESPEVCRLLYAGNASPHFLNLILCWRSLSYPDYRVIWSIRIPPFRIKLLSREFPTGKLCTA